MYAQFHKRTSRIYDIARWYSIAHGAHSASQITFPRRRMTIPFMYSSRFSSLKTPVRTAEEIPCDSGVRRGNAKLMVFFSEIMLEIELAVLS